MYVGNKVDDRCCQAALEGPRAAVDTATIGAATTLATKIDATSDIRLALRREVFILCVF